MKIKNKEIITRLNDQLSKYVGIAVDPKLDSTLFTAVKNDIQKVFDEIIESHDGLYSNNFPIEFQNDLGRFKMNSNGECFFYPKVKVLEVNLTFTIPPSGDSLNTFEQLLDDAHKKFVLATSEDEYQKPSEEARKLFINKIKIDKNFAKRCQVKIEEKELSLMERRNMVSQEMYNQIYNGGGPETLSHPEIDQWNIPSREIKITYNKKTAINYE